MTLETPINIQVFFINDKTYKYYEVTDIIRKDGLILLKNKTGQAVLIERNVTQIAEI